MKTASTSYKLYLALRGRHPFSRFKESLDSVGLLDEWYAFKTDWYAQKAEEWLQEEKVDFLDGKVVCSGNTLTWIEDEE